jgi:alpha-L-arabinofuranosidase
MQIGACLTYDNGGTTWGRTMLDYLVNAGGSSAIGFCIAHQYNAIWWQYTADTDQYYAKVLESGSVAHRIRSLRQLIDSYDYDWELAVTEWNLHPTFDYGGDPNAERDLAAAVYQASVLHKFIDIGVDTATLFNLRSDSTEHFGMIQDSNATVLRPPFYVFDWYGRYFKGNRCLTELKSPMTIWSFPGCSYYPPVPKTVSSYIEANASYNSNDDQVCIMLVNKHLTQSTTLKCIITGSTAADSAIVKTLNASSVSSDVPVITEANVSITNNILELNLPAHSVTVVLTQAGI